MGVNVSINCGHQTVAVVTSPEPAQPPPAVTCTFSIRGPLPYYHHVQCCVSAVWRSSNNNQIKQQHHPIEHFVLKLTFTANIWYHEVSARCSLTATFGASLLHILHNTGCPISLGPLSFCHFLGFWSTYRGTIHSHRIAHEILIPKLTLLSILREILTKLQHKT